MFIGHPRNGYAYNVDAVKQDGRRPDQCLMRSGETKYAMTAAGITWSVGRNVRGTLAVVETKLESWRAGIGTRRHCKSAERYQQALGGDGIGDNDADQRSPEALGPPARFVHSTPTTPVAIIKTA